MREKVLIALLILVPAGALAQQIPEGAPAPDEQASMNALAGPADPSAEPLKAEQVKREQQVAQDEEEAMKLQRLKIGFKSLFFTTVPLSGGILLFMFLVNRKGGRDKFSPFFGEGQFLQLVVIVMVAGNVCSLAIMGILDQSEIAAIYGGIVGYVLGRKTSGTPSNPQLAAGPAPGGAPAPPPEP